MDTLLFALNAVLPIVLLIAAGWFFKKIKLFSAEFVKVGNKFCFKVLLPVLLFHNTYSIDSLNDINWSFILYGVLSMVVVFGIGILVVVLTEKDNTKRGVLLQCFFRSNYAIIGIPLATTLFGSAGAASASILSAFTIPVFNMLAVVSLSMFPQKLLDGQNPEQMTSQTKKNSFVSVLKGIATNPLILGVVSGLIVLGIRQLFVLWDWGFRLYNLAWLKTSIGYIANTTTPLALLVLGGGFEFAAVRKQMKGIVIGTIGRCVVVPALGLLFACLVFPDFSGGEFAALIALFCTPVAVSSAVMAKEMGGDSELAGQLVVWTTIISSITIFVGVVVLKSLGFL